MRRDPLSSPTTLPAAGLPAFGNGMTPVLLVTTAVMAIVLAVYWPTLRSMVEIWSRSDTFAHGFVVPLISMWLVWRHRALLAGAAVRPSSWAVLATFFTGFGWLLGELAEVNSLRQFALVALLVLAVPAIAGIEVARRLAFPLGFLFFAVPFGEFLLPRLMEWTATFAVTALKASGIPVYREGLHFVIPTGNWSVVEACSGVRYLIASVMVGTLYAHLTYRSPRRRLAFVAVSFIVPVLANWLRAYMIVMLGHLSGNHLAVGVDHLIYGWVFFGVVMLLMFWVGARWREEEAPIGVYGSLSQLRVATPGSAPFRVILFGALIFTVVASAPIAAEYLLVARSGATHPALAVPAAIAGWSGAAKPATAWRPRFVEPNAQHFASFVEGEREVGVYLAYYRQQTSSRKLVSSDNVLVASNDPQWLRLTGGERTMIVDGMAVAVRVTDLGHRSGERLRVWDWYWVDGHTTASPARAKLLTALAQLAGRGDDSAAVVLATRQGSGPQAAAEADAVLEAFANAALPRIEAVLETARGTR